MGLKHPTSGSGVRGAAANADEDYDDDDVAAATADDDGADCDDVAAAANDDVR